MDLRKGKTCYNRLILQSTVRFLSETFQICLHQKLTFTSFINEAKDIYHPRQFRPSINIWWNWNVRKLFRYCDCIKRFISSVFLLKFDFLTLVKTRNKVSGVVWVYIVLARHLDSVRLEFFTRLSRFISVEVYEWIHVTQSRILVIHS